MKPKTKCRTGTTPTATDTRARAVILAVCFVAWGCVDRDDGAGQEGGESSGGTDTSNETGASSGSDGGEIPSWSCERPYDGPQGGQRTDGPENPSVESCASLSDELILERYADPEMKTPQGFYYEEPGHLLQWADPCSNSIDDTIDNAAQALPDATVESDFTTEYFHEVAVCEDGRRTLYRNLRCDYFDGTVLAGGPHEDATELGFLASLLWFIENHNISGYHLLAVISDGGSATLCTTQTVFGDFGLCDEITLHETRYEITPEGTVTLGSDATVRTIEGKCN